MLCAFHGGTGRSLSNGMLNAPSVPWSKPKTPITPKKSPVFTGLLGFKKSDDVRAVIRLQVRPFPFSRPA